MKISLLINVSDGTSALPFILDPDFPAFSSSSRMPMTIGPKSPVSSDWSAHTGLRRHHSPSLQSVLWVYLDSRGLQHPANITTV